MDADWHQGPQLVEAPSAFPTHFVTVPSALDDYSICSRLTCKDAQTAAMAFFERERGREGAGQKATFPSHHQLKGLEAYTL